MRIAIVAFAPLIALAALCGAPPSGHAAGGSNVRNVHDIFLTSEWDRSKPPEKVRSEVEMDALLLELGTFQGKYKVLVLRLTNSGTQPVALSGADDRIDVLFGDKRVRAVLDIASQPDVPREAHGWDLGRVLSYPVEVDSDQAINIYFFVPEFDYAGPPTGLRLHHQVARPHPGDAQSARRGGIASVRRARRHGRHDLRYLEDAARLSQAHAAVAVARAGSAGGIPLHRRRRRRVPIRPMALWRDAAAAALPRQLCVLAGLRRVRERAGWLCPSGDPAAAGCARGDCAPVDREALRPPRRLHPSAGRDRARRDRRHVDRACPVAAHGCRLDPRHDRTLRRVWRPRRRRHRRGCPGRPTVSRCPSIAIC